MTLLRKLIELDNSRLFVFFDITFYDLGKKDEFCYFAQKYFEESTDLFLKIFPEKWWKANFQQLAEISGEEFNNIEKNLNEIFVDIIGNYYQENEAARNKTMEMREVLKAGLVGCDTYSDKTKRKKFPPIDKPIPENAKVTELPKSSKKIIIKSNIFDCIADRKSRRKFIDKEISLDELSYLLWATQGVRKSLYDNLITLRTVPSGGARQPFETYLFINKVTGLEVGIYRYQALSHSLVFLFEEENLEQKVIEAALEQTFAGECAVCFIWSTIPYRCEYMYTTEAKKIIAQDSGHLCQNLYLASESIECGTCAIAAYSQEKMDSLLKLDGIDEFVVYVAPVGKVIE